WRLQRQLNSPRRVSFHSHLRSLLRYLELISFVLPKVKAGKRHLTLRHPSRHLLSAFTALRNPLSGGNQGPVGGIAKFQIELPHLRPAIRVPDAARTHVHESPAGF